MDRISRALLLLLVSNRCTIIGPVKRCHRCGQTKPLSEFHVNRHRADGVQTYCKPCQAEIDRARYQAALTAGIPWKRSNPGIKSTYRWMVSLKTGKPCTDCGRVFPPAAMQWDHLPGHKKLADVSSLRDRPRDVILAEVAKCELVCVNCHTIRTVKRAGWVQGTRVVQDAVAFYYA